jgi:hypothetical protein
MTQWPTPVMDQRSIDELGDTKGVGDGRHAAEVGGIGCLAPRVERGQAFGETSWRTARRG